MDNSYDIPQASSNSFSEIKSCVVKLINFGLVPINSSFSTLSNLLMKKYNIKCYFNSIMFSDLLN